VVLFQKVWVKNLINSKKYSFTKTLLIAENILFFIALDKFNLTPA
jgi:hypothetical protein